MLTFKNYTAIYEKNIKELQTLIRANRDPLVFGHRLLQLQKQLGTDLGGKYKVIGAAGTREAQQKHKEYWKKQ
jgi:hypothetical protein